MLYKWLYYKTKAKALQTNTKQIRIPGEGSNGEFKSPFEKQQQGNNYQRAVSYNYSPVTFLNSKMSPILPKKKALPKNTTQTQEHLYREVNALRT